MSVEHGGGATSPAWIDSLHDQTVSAKELFKTSSSKQKGDTVLTTLFDSTV